MNDLPANDLTVNDSPFNVTLGLSILHFLGPNLYSNISAVLSEMVANAWDAGAHLVNIQMNIDNDEIVVMDNGLGMSLTSINEKYLHIGYLRRKSEASPFTSDGRHVMGRKGIGKLAAFSFAQEMEIVSNDGNGTVGCKLDWIKIEAAIENGQKYFPEVVDVQGREITKGTTVTLRKLNKNKLAELTNVQAVRRRLARRFLILGDRYNFQLVVAGAPITRSDCPFFEAVDYLWYLGSESQDLLPQFQNATRTDCLENTVVIDDQVFKVRGWIGTVEVPGDIREDGNNTIALYAHGKLIQEDILSEYQEAQMYAQYIVGNIEVDFLDSDDKPDIVTSDRQRVIQDDPRYKIVREYIRGRVSDVGNKWTLWRNEDKSKSALQNPTVMVWYQGMKKTNKIKATRLLSKVDEIAGISEEQRDQLYRACISKFEEIKDTKGIKALDQAGLLKLLGVTIEQPQTSPTTPTTPSQPSPKPRRPKSSSPPSTDIPTNFSKIQDILEKIDIEDQLRTIALYDLNQSKKAFIGAAYKACAVMFGAILEGVMLGTIRRADVLEKLKNDGLKAPKVLLNKGLISYDIDQLKANVTKFEFEDLKTVIDHLMPDIEKHEIGGIQVFRNTIHPWKVIKEPRIYANIDSTRLSHLQTALIILLQHIADWKP